MLTPERSRSAQRVHDQPEPSQFPPRQQSKIRSQTASICCQSAIYGANTVLLRVLTEYEWALHSFVNIKDQPSATEAAISSQSVVLLLEEFVEAIDEATNRANDNLKQHLHYKSKGERKFVRNPHETEEVDVGDFPNAEPLDRNWDGQ